MAEESYSALQDRLFAAARGGDPESVRVLVTQEPRLLTAAADFGESALHVAARHGQLAVMEVLVAAGQPVTLGRRRGRTQQRDGQTPLASAADAGQLDAMSWLLDRGAPVDDPHLVGAAAASGHLEAIHLLVRAGADPHPRWADGRANARTAALAGGHHEADRLLAELGVRLPLPPPPVVSDLPPAAAGALAAARADAVARLGLPPATEPQRCAAAIDRYLDEARRPGGAPGDVDLQLGSLLGEGVVTRAGWSWCGLDWGRGVGFAVISPDRGWAMLPIAVVGARLRAAAEVSLEQCLEAIAAGHLPPSEPGAATLIS